jgi:arylsulfatase A-like enzyme
MYGAKPGEASFANNCLLARRLVERGVRFVNLYHEAWDHHSDVAGGIKAQCGETDQASAALIMDLKQRGLLDETLVVWGGEFGRTPMVENNPTINRSMGRDHHPKAYSMWLAGGGIKPGITLGKTDDIGFNIVEDPVHVHDLQATILHLLGVDHTKLTYHYQGRDFRLTDVSGEVVTKLLA